MQINPRTFADATKLADNVYELVLTNWGNRGQKQDADNGSIQYPPVKSLANGADPILGTVPGTFMLAPLPSLAAIAIAPRSDLDRCILHYASLPQTKPELSHVGPTTPIANGFVNQGGILESEQLLAIGAPLVGQLNGPIIVRAHPAGWFGDTYFTSTPATTLPFGTAAGPNFIVPELRLLLFMTGRAALPPTIRAPFQTSFGVSPTDANEQTRLIAPVLGRKHIRVLVHNPSTGNVTVRLTGTYGVQSGSLPAITTESYEVPLVGATVIPSGGAAVLAVDEPAVAFLLVKTTSVNFGPLDGFTMDVTATDR